MRVFRSGQKPTAPTGQWSDAEVLQAVWEMNEQRYGIPNPMRKQAMDLKIPELNFDTAELQKD